MGKNGGVLFTFGEYELDIDRFELRRAGTPCAIEPQVFDVLRYLVSHRDRVVSKNELLDSIWGDRFVSESALTSRIKAARRVLGDSGKSQEVIRTTHGRGYRFVAEVIEQADSAEPPLTVQAPSPAGESPRPAEPRITGAAWPLVGRRAEMETIAEWFADPERGGVVLEGSAGMGKTRLAEELVAVAERAGIPTARAAGHHEARSIPLGAFAHLVPTDVMVADTDSGAKLDRATLFHRARAALDTGRRSLLFVDDIDQVDELSRALLASLVVDRAAFAVITRRSESEPVTTVDTLVKDGHLARCEIGPLTPDQIETLLHRALGGPIVADTMQQLCDASLGNPGIVRQLVESSRASGTLCETRGVWELTGPLGSTASLESLVADRLAGLDDPQRHTIELLALAGELGLELLAGVVGDEPLEELDRRGLLTIRNNKRRQEIGLAHPLYGEIIRSTMPMLRARRIRRQLAEMLEEVGARRRDDRVRVVAWRMDVGGRVEPDLLVQAARLAVLDHDLDVAERLLERAVAEESTPVAVQMLAELAFRNGQTQRVEELLSSLDLDALDDRRRAMVVRRRATNLFFNTMRYEDSYALLDGEIARTGSPESRVALEAHRAMLLANGGQVDEAISLAEAALPSSVDGVRIELLRALALAYVHAARPLAALELAREGQRLHAAMDNDVALPGLSMLMFVELGAATAALRIDEARSLAERMKREHPEVLPVWIDNAVGRLELTAGRPAAARRALTPVINESRARGHHTTERWVLALHAMAHIMEDRADLARPELERVSALEDGGRGLYHPEIDRAHAWYAAATGDLTRARELLLASSVDCSARGAAGTVSLLLHDVARFGDPESVVDRLDEIATASDGDLFVARALYVAGMVHGDPGSIEQALDLFESGGAGLYAAEAATALASLLRRLGRHAEAEGAATRANDLRHVRGTRLVSPALDA